MHVVVAKIKMYVNQINPNKQLKEKLIESCLFIVAYIFHAIEILKWPLVEGFEF